MYTLLRVTRVFCALRWLNKNAKKASRDTLRFLPPYCPQLNPVEMVIANAKAALREQEVLFSRTRRPRSLVLWSILQVSREICEKTVSHCGY